MLAYSLLHRSQLVIAFTVQLVKQPADRSITVLAVCESIQLLTSISMAQLSLPWISLTASIILIDLLCPPWLCAFAVTEQSEEAAERSVGDRMTWIPVSNSSALCNDFTKAGFFIRQNISSNKWIVFLEGGGLCSDVDSCNRRFFVNEVRIV